MSAHPRLRADVILNALVEEGVEFVVIGGLAAQVHGSPSLTGDVDICHSLDRANLERVERVLRKLKATRRMMPTGVLAPIDERALRSGDVFTLATRAGDLDLLAHPDPDLDFDKLSRNAIDVEILGVRVRAAGIDDLIAMKRAAGRPKDRVELEILGALREEIDRRNE